MSSDSAKAYVPGFDYDIFISYAHVDDLKGWVHAFHQALEIKLAQRFGRVGRVQIWRDKNLSGDALFDDQSLGFDTTRVSTGVELRFHLPIFPVPLRLIYGTTLREVEGDRTSSFTFSIGRSF